MVHGLDEGPGRVDVGGPGPLVVSEGLLPPYHLASELAAAGLLGWLDTVSNGPCTALNPSRTGPAEARAGIPHPGVTLETRRLRHTYLHSARAGG